MTAPLYCAASEVTTYHSQRTGVLPSRSPHANSRTPDGLRTRLSEPSAPQSMRPPARAVELAVLRRRTCLRDGGRRRNHAPDRKRAVDHPMEADQGRDPAAQRGRMAARLRPLQADAAI